MVMGQLSSELEVRVSANELWDVYSTLKLAKLVCELLPDVVEKFEVMEGDGGVDTVLKLTFSSGTSYKEKFTKIDHENRLKEAEVVEGGYLELGFSLYRVSFEIIEKDTDSSIIKSTIEYEIDEESASNVSLISIKPLEAISQVIGKYFIEKKANASS